MKSTKIMLAILATFLITWCVIGTIGYLLSDQTFKQSMSDSRTIFFMVLLGWIPCIVVSYDLDAKLKNN